MDATFKKYKMKYLGTSTEKDTKLWNYYYGDMRRTIVITLGRESENSPEVLCVSYSFPKNDVVTEEFRDALLDCLGMDLTKPIERFEGFQRTGSPYSNTQFNMQLASDIKQYSVRA